MYPSHLELERACPVYVSVALYKPSFSMYTSILGLGLLSVLYGIPDRDISPFLPFDIFPQLSAH